MKDTKLMGYDVPEGSIVVTSLYGSHTDQQKWDNPELFAPERFLDENGKLALKKDFSVPFGAGKIPEYFLCLFLESNDYL